MNKNDVKTKCKYKRWISFSWGSSKYERNGSRAQLTWRPSGVTYFACVPLRSYFYEHQKNEIYFLIVFERFLPENVHTTQCKLVDAILSEDGKIIQTSMKHFLLLLLRNATKHNSIKFSSASLHVSSDKFWYCLKTLKCNNVKNSCLLVNKRTLRKTKLRRTFVKHLPLKNEKNSKRNLRNQLIFYDARNACLMSDTGTSPCISFFQPPYLHKMFWAWTVGNRLLKRLCDKMLDWLNFHFGRNNWFNTCVSKEILSK